jgi:two-component system, OmpR family, sensor kinase
VTLRSRLLLSIVVIFVAMIGAGVVVAGTQSNRLLGQLDNELLRASPFIGRPGPLPSGEPPPGFEAPVSTLFVGRFGAEGELLTLVQGALLSDVPDLDAAAALSRLDAPFNVDAANSGGRFRVLVSQVGDEGLIVVGLPLDEVDDAMQRLHVTLVIAGSIICVLVGVLAWWVNRLGIRPIKDLTTTAEAIAAGERGERVGQLVSGTEAGRMAAAFNTMLDSRDAAESRVRQFAADASHELRTPLTSIRGYLDLLAEGQLPVDRQADALRRAQSEAVRMASLVEDLLLLARLDHRREPRRDLVDIGAVLRDASLDGRAMQPQRALTVTVTGSLFAYADDAELRQVISALVHNAVVHTPTDAPISLSARADGEDVVIDVEDRGPGLSPDLASKVFDRFARGDTSRHRGSGGAGLGLSIARAIVEAHDGTIHVHSSTDGTTFTVRLPRADGVASVTHG